MLFIIDHRHSAENCPAGVCKPNWDFAVKMNDSAKACGVQVIEGFVDLRGHRMYFAVDATYEQQVYDFAKPLMGVGRLQVVPVIRWSAIVESVKRSKVREGSP